MHQLQNIYLHLSRCELATLLTITRLKVLPPQSTFNIHVHMGTYSFISHLVTSLHCAGVLTTQHKCQGKNIMLDISNGAIQFDMHGN
jgi:hypothetical protein